MLTAQEISAAIQAAHNEGRALAIVTLMTPRGAAHKLLVEASGAIGTLGAAALDLACTQRAQSLLADEQQESAVIRLAEVASDELTSTALGSTKPTAADKDERLLFEIARPPLELIICGGGHVGQAVARVAGLLDFQITVIDDRAEFAARDKFPDARVRLRHADFTAALQSLRINSSSHVVIVTRGHRHDEMCLREVIARQPRYLGMIGSRRRTTTIREHLRREGLAAEPLHQVRAPIGLDIGAQTPEEIALAIMAEIVLVRRGGTGAPKCAAGPMAKAK